MSLQSWLHIFGETGKNWHHWNRERHRKQPVWWKSSAAFCGPLTKCANLKALPWPHDLWLWSWSWWPRTWLTNRRPSVLWHCWLGHLTHNIVSEMTYNVSSGTLYPAVPYHTSLGLEGWYPAVPYHTSLGLEGWDLGVDHITDYNVVRLTTSVFVAVLRTASISQSRVIVISIKSRQAVTLS